MKAFTALASAVRWQQLQKGQSAAEATGGSDALPVPQIKKNQQGPAEEVGGHPSNQKSMLSTQMKMENRHDTNSLILIPSDKK